MEIYNKLINEVVSINGQKKTFPFNRDECCKMSGKSELILSKETAFELGGSALPAIGITLFSTDKEIKDEVLLYGKDIGELNADTPYARITVVSLDDNNLPAEDNIYRTLKDIEFTKYHFYPKNCLIRLSPSSRREQIRISKSALSEGLSLKNIGFGLIDEYKKNPAVSAIKIIFVTEKDYDYKKLKITAEKAHKITESLNKISDGLEIDCNSCELKPICDEVEGMKELHFGKEKKI